MTSTAQELHPAPTLEPGRTILELKGLEKRYPGTHALKPVNLAFKAGEIHAIVGENGAGKSTLIKLLTGVMPRTSGDVIWEGKP
ncbi:ATP-binding cassette domain-containing protein, partial [Mesorhizobium sp.]